METAFAPLAQWLGEHQDWILIAIAVMAFLESLAVVGIVVPGVALLFAAGTAAGSTDIDVIWVLLAAFCGAVAGDGLSFLLGYHYHAFIRRIPPFKTHPQWIDKGEQFFARYGLMGIVIGRFVGPIRPVMPLVAGFMQMRPVNFFSVNMLSAIAWAPFYLMPGYLVGASLEGTNALSGRHLLFLSIMIVGGWLLAQLLWWTHDHIRQRRNKLLLAMVTGSACLALFISLSLVMQLDQVTDLNQRFSHWALSLRHRWLDDFFIVLTQLGYRAPMTLWGVLVTLALLLQRNTYAATLWVGTLLLGQTLLVGLKQWIAWPRPNLVAMPPESWAFPSGHTTMGLVFLGTLTILCLPGVPGPRQKAILSAVCILATTIAAARLYLTVHWPTDILGGLLLGGMILACLHTLVLQRPFRTVRPWPLIAATLAAWVISLFTWVVPHYGDIVHRYLPLSLS
ncbi:MULTISPECIES: bifunctional DedA family/phosphatase PAP2 family protein [unclassified Ketobacter]|uniref:bifunctional DedA family/phosphatase PAP2 family protein n=1 Tax=unclassified Ketobacter TaxID=2639109 RepID=UPI000F28ECD5|nr:MULTISPECIES: bifunctional DedA family/phosphatase PAP2 family protein [unclassified Ketobacter]RLT91084.1 MAG: phosphatase PAP2 family protein [Ketobacter sp. GenoA1]RLT98481.1 MAG: phosphatase PAP2 family protein [Ketobacter sp.]